MHRNQELSWLGREDSNLRMVESKSTALPLGDAPKRRRKAAGLSAKPVPATPVYRVKSFISTAQFQPREAWFRHRIHIGEFLGCGLAIPLPDFPLFGLRGHCVGRQCQARAVERKAVSWEDEWPLQTPKRDRKP